MNKFEFDPDRQAAVAAARASNPERVAGKRANLAYLALKQQFRHIHNPDEIVQRQLTRHILDNKPFSFAAFYGSGGKQDLDSNDYDWLDHLVRLGQSATAAASHRPGSRISLLLADVHGQANGYIKDHADLRYLNQVQALAQSLGVGTIWMSQWYHNFGITIPKHQADISSETLELFATQSGHTAHFTQQLVESAQRHHQNGLSPLEAAQYYAEMRLRERQPLRQTYHDTIVIINGGPANLQLLPKEGLAFIFTGKPGPWFAQNL